MSQPRSLRHLLKAYTIADCCRLASIVQHLLCESSESIASRDAVVEVWAKRYPQHTKQKRPKNVRGRITKALSYLKAANIMTTEGSGLKVLNAERLQLSAANLEIVEKDGRALSPTEWSRQPTAPPEFHDLQAELEVGRLEAVAALEDQ